MFCLCVFIRVQVHVYELVCVHLCPYVCGSQRTTSAIILQAPSTFFESEFLSSLELYHAG